MINLIDTLSKQQITTRILSISFDDFPFPRNDNFIENLKVKSGGMFLMLLVVLEGRTVSTHNNLQNMLKLVEIF
jgi:hypothetical protein